MAKQVLKIAILAIILTIVALYTPVYFSGPYGLSYSSTIHASAQEKNDNIVIDSYCESSGVNSIINLENCSMANKIAMEKGQIRIVRDNAGEPENAYAKNIEDE
ncbi:MAG: hypothetical protein Q8R38_00405 [Candidatus Omnitrophota bacterium]|nr:hypothetical protein [Candidatus Omnitrophota bacterium]